MPAKVDKTIFKRKGDQTEDETTDKKVIYFDTNSDISFVLKKIYVFIYVYKICEYDLVIPAYFLEFYLWLALVSILSSYLLVS